MGAGNAALFEGKPRPSAANQGSPAYRCGCVARESTSPNIVTVTQHACRWCGRTFAIAAGRGRPRLYCKRACRQRDFEARHRALELGLGEHELVVTREELESIRDRLFVLGHTIEDAERDLRQPEARRAKELQRVLHYVLASARDCVRP